MRLEDIKIEDKYKEPYLTLPSSLLDRIDIKVQKAIGVSLQEQNRLVQLDTEKLKSQIKFLLAKHDMTVISHYYVDGSLQNLADETGGIVADSLDMAKFGQNIKSNNLVVCGVRFMGESAKILSPNKRVFMPTLEAECSLDLSCPPREFKTFCDEHPDRTVVVYANTSALVKAHADWVVTSSNALDIVRYLKNKNQKIIWAPDKHLGKWIQNNTQADMLIWQGHCIVHDEFKAFELENLRKKHPTAIVLAHPESPEDVINQADIVGSTKKLLAALNDRGEKIFIVATDYGIFHKMQSLHPDKELIVAPTDDRKKSCAACAHCPWMAQNSLLNLYETLMEYDTQPNKTIQNEILLDTEVITKAQKSLQRMIDFAI